MIDQNLQPLIDFYLEVKSATLVSDKFGLSKSKVYRILRDNNVDTTIDRVKAGERVRKYKLDPYYFSEINTRDKAYITGILHSDGCITSTTKQVRIKLTDLELMREINSKIYKDRPLYTDSSTKEGHKKNALLVITHSQIYADVQKHGCCLDKTYNLEFPTTISDKLMGDYLRGFFDGDGSIYIYEKKSYRPATVKIVATRKWAEGLIEWLHSENIKAAIYDDKRHDNRITGLYVCNVPDLIKFYNLIYEDLDSQIFLKRKYDAYTEYVNFKLNKQ